MPVTRDSAYIGGCPWPRPRQGPPKQGDCQAGLACPGAAGWGLLASQDPRCGAPLPLRAGRAWSTFGPHAIGPERFATVSSGTSFAQVAGAILGKQARAQIPDKDEAAGSSPARPTNEAHDQRKRWSLRSQVPAHRMPPNWVEVL